MVIRSLRKQELTLVKRALDGWGVFDYFADKNLFINEIDGDETVCVSTKALDSADLSKAIYAGLPIGRLYKKFVPTVAGADLFVRAGCSKKFCVRLSSHGQDLVLYGRDVMGDSITDASCELEENQLVILMNESGNAIGVGRTRFDGKRLKQKGKITITTVHDAGYYLRDEGN